MNLVFSHQAAHSIKHLHPLLKKGIREKLKSLLKDPYLGKPLQKELMGFRSLAFQRYRIIYQVASHQEILVYLVRHRKDVYTVLQKMVKQ